MSLQVSPPPASISIAWTSTLPRSCRGTRLLVIGRRADRASPSPSRSAKVPSACSPTWETTWSPPGSTTTRRVLLACISEVPFCLGLLALDKLSFPRQEGFSANTRRSVHVVA